MDTARVAAEIGTDHEFVEKIMKDIKEEEFKNYIKEHIGNLKNVGGEVKAFWAKKNSY